MAETNYKVVPIRFRGRLRPVVFHRTEEASPLVAITNYVHLLGEGDVDPADVAETMDQQVMIEAIWDEVDEMFKKLMKSNSRRRQRVKGRRESLEQITRSLHARTVLDPLSESCQTFQATDQRQIFTLLEAKVRHGWVLDPNDEDLSIFKGVPRSMIAEKISEVERTTPAASVGDPPLIKRLHDFMNASITTYGLSRLHRTFKENDLAVLYANDQYHVLYKHQGDLFTLEASEGKTMQLPDAVWKKLTVQEEDSFYVTADFTPTKGQQNENIANEWWIQKSADLFEPTPNEKSKSKGNLSKDIDNSSISESGFQSGPVCDDAPDEHTKPEASTSTESSSSLTTAYKFFDFLSKFRDGSSKEDVPHFEGVVKGMILHTKSPKLYVPFDFIQKHNRELAIDIQDEYPRIHNELLEHVTNYLIKCGADKDVQAELEIHNLPGPKSVQRFLQFISENDMLGTCLLYDAAKDDIPTGIGRSMALGFLNYIFDRFEEGKCWGTDGWKADEMEIRNNGTVFVITKEPVEDLTPDLGVANLLLYVDIVFSRFRNENTSPAYFEAFVEAILLFPERDSSKWRPYVKFMRAPFALKAPLVRSTLIVEFCRALSMQIGIKPQEHTVITRIITKDWRPKARSVKPFKQVYHYKNNVSADYCLDKWENSHWHVLKYSRNFIEHVMEYIKTMHEIHDISIAELMLARRLESYIADSVRTIVLEYGVDGLLSSAWGHFELSDSSTMPLQLAKNDTIGFTIPSVDQQTELQEKLIIHVSPEKSGDHVAPWVYSEVCRPVGSDSLSHLKYPKLAELKKLLENESFKVNSLDTDKIVEDCIMVSKIIKAEERKIAVQGPFCEEYKTILDIIGTWLHGVANS